MRLLLLRHAKAGPPQGGDDHGRTLTPRGIEEATSAGTRMAEQGWIPDLALVSDARRTRQTFDLAAAQLPVPPRLTLLPGLYNADPETILEAIAAAPPATLCLLVIGHNPGLAETVQRLVRTAPEALRATLAQGFPTATLAVVTVDGGITALRTGGLLEALITPP